MDAPSQGSYPLKIFLLDDDDISRTLACYSLRKLEGAVVVREARTFQEGLFLLEKEEFDCALIDYQLPDGNGVDFIAEIKSRKKGKLPAILMTAHGSERLAVEVMKKGAFDYISKGDLSPDVLWRGIQSSISLCKSENLLAAQTQKLHEVNAELKQANLKLENLTRMDPLTNVLNRRGFQEVLTRECQHAAREGQYLIVLLIDLDSFKQINDTRGHDAGDAVLEAVAGRLREKLRVTDYVARLGGDEFMLLLRKTRRADGIEVAHKIRLAIAEPIPWGNTVIEATASIGLAVVRHGVRSIDELLAMTHGALTRCKETGKNRVACDGMESDEPIQGKESLINSLSLLGQKGGLRIISQPIFCMLAGDVPHSEEVIGYEFVPRSNIAGYEMPNDFFHLAANAQMLSSVDCLCFEKCILSTLSFSDHLRFYINIFPSTILSVSHDDLIATFPSQRPKENYFVQLSEKQFKGNMGDLVKEVVKLRESGVQVVIDDVGFGHTGLETLISLKPHSIKIDASCSNNIANNTEKSLALEQLVKMAQSLGCETMVKEVSSEDDRAVLVNLGVTFAQGDVFKVPA